MCVADAKFHFTFDALHRCRSIYSVRRHSFAGWKNDSHDFQSLILEKCRGRRLFKLVAQREQARYFAGQQM
jgi:hypothetical protein